MTHYRRRTDKVFRQFRPVLIAAIIFWIAAILLLAGCGSHPTKETLFEVGCVIVMPALAGPACF